MMPLLCQPWNPAQAPSGVCLNSGNCPKMEISLPRARPHSSGIPLGCSWSSDGHTEPGTAGSVPSPVPTGLLLLRPYCWVSPNRDLVLGAQSVPKQGFIWYWGSQGVPKNEFGVRGSWGVPKQGLGAGGHSVSPNRDLVLKSQHIPKQEFIWCWGTRSAPNMDLLVGSWGVPKHGFGVGGTGCPRTGIWFWGHEVSPNRDLVLGDTGCLQTGLDWREGEQGRARHWLSFGMGGEWDPLRQGIEVQSHC